MTQPQNTMTYKLIDTIKIFITALILLVTVVVISLDGFIRLQKTRVETDQYKKAAFCKYGDECRKETEAEILDSFTYRACCTTFNFNKILFYGIKIKLANGETYSITLLPNLDIPVKDFKLKNVYLPAPKNSTDKMVEASFIKGQRVKIEMWHHKPTVIYSMFVFGAPTLSGKNEYAIPTADNPLVHDAHERNRLVEVGTALVIAVLLVITIIWIL